MERNIGMEVFSTPESLAMTDEQFHKIVNVLEAKLEKNLIKTRKQGNTELSYIGGHTVIRKLNEAFGYKWSFEIVEDTIVPSQPKVDKYKNNELTEQPPVVKVKGRLTVPGFGVKEQYGSKVLIGGATEQEAAFKSASTDALKKCATMFNIGLELYDDDEPDQAQGAPAPQSQPKTYNSNKAQPTTTVATPATPAVNYDAADIKRIKELKSILGVPQDDNTKLDPYVREFLDDQKATFKNIGPNNLKAFNVFLSKMVPNV